MTHLALIGGLGAGTLVLYLWGVRRYDSMHRARRFPRMRAAAFVAGVLVTLAALLPPFDRYADLWFAMHMVQHLLLMLVAAPLLVIGTPLRLARQTGPEGVRWLVGRIVRSSVVQVLQFPVVSWALFVGVLWASHYSALYEAALEHPAIHHLEHALYLVAALLFWTPVVALEPSRWRISHPMRLLYLVTAGPPSVFLALSFYASNRVFYRHYEVIDALLGRSALADQQAGGEVMWILGGLPLLVAMLVVAASWARHDAQVARRIDAAADRANMAPGSDPGNVVAE
jgi:putative membrane protein